MVLYTCVVPARTYDDLERENVELRALVHKLTVEVAELRARVDMNSRNSSKPPSSDGYGKPAPKSRRTRSGKKPGKQPGDPGRHLAQRDTPDATTTHAPTTCAGCGDDLSDAEVTATIRRQVFDLPPVALFCTEHQAQRRRCSLRNNDHRRVPTRSNRPRLLRPRPARVRVLPGDPSTPARRSRRGTLGRHLRGHGLGGHDHRNGPRRRRHARQLLGPSQRPPHRIRGRARR